MDFIGGKGLLESAGDFNSDCLTAVDHFWRGQIAIDNRWEPLVENTSDATAVDATKEVADAFFRIYLQLCQRPRRLSLNFNVLSRLRSKFRNWRRSCKR